MWFFSGDPPGLGGRFQSQLAPKQPNQFDGLRFMDSGFYLLADDDSG